MAIPLNFDTFAAWFISAEVNYAGHHPREFESSIQAFFGHTSEFTSAEWEDFADTLLRDSQDDLLINFEQLIMISDRKDEYLTKQEAFQDDNFAMWDSQLEKDMSGWLEDDRLVGLLALGFKAQWEFTTQVMKAVAEGEHRNERTADQR